VAKGGTLKFVRRHRVTLASVGVVVIGAAALLVFALSSRGYRVRHVDLNDGGIWVTSNREGLFGRLNKPAGSLDAAMNPVAKGSTILDVRQDGAAAVAWDQSEGKLYPVDVVRSVIVKDHGVSVGAGERIELAGGVIAVLDPATGNIWAQRADVSAGVGDLAGLDPSAEPLASVDPPASNANSSSTASLAVSPTGTIVAASNTGKVVSISSNQVGFGSPQYSQISSNLDSVQITAVGSQAVVFDAASGTLDLPGGKEVHVDTDAKSRLQAPSPDGSRVVIATSKSLLSIEIGSGRPTTLAEGLSGVPAQPVWLGDCVYSAWSGSPGAYEHSCANEPATPGNVKNIGALAQPVFRVNRNLIVLNDLSIGTIIDLESGKNVENWQQVKPPPVVDNSDKTKNENPDTAHQDQPPKAVDDVLGARPGRTTVLHVLDNDSDPQGYILSITSVTAPDNASAKVFVAPDGQTIQITLGSDAGSTHFRYTIDDGKGLSATASVTVESHSADQNVVPNLRPGFVPQTWNVVAGGSLSLPVIGDWRDGDGDPVVLFGATASSGSVTTTPDGRVGYTAGVVVGPQSITYQVADGVVGSAPASSTIAVNVLSPTSSTMTAPTAEPDVVRGTVGQPVTIHPLDNDLPGADPTSPGAKLALAGDVASPEGATVVTDTSSDVVTLTGARPGSFSLAYTAAFGNAPFGQGKIRVDVVAAPASPEPPVAMPDNAVVYGQAPATVDVLANDFDPSGQLLVVQRATPADGTDQLQVAIIQGRWVRVAATRPNVTPNPQVVHYTITDGTTTAATGEITVTQLPALTTDTPVPQDDYAMVRAGDSVLAPVLDNDTTPGGDPVSLASSPLPQSPGQLTVTATSGATGADNGKAYVSGRFVRYVAPSTVDSQKTFTIDYVAQDPAGDQATGHLLVTVTPAPPDPSLDRPPTPRPVEARVVAGGTISVNVPTSSVDPEGDSVAVKGIGSAPTLGRVIALGATSITYQAFPTSAGTDSFTYEVADSFGKTGRSTVRIAVVPPGDTQPPVAVDDQVTSAPGSKVQVDVLANDLVAPDDTVTIGPAGGSGATVPDGVTFLSPTGPIEIITPQADGKPVVVLYEVTDGIGSPSVAKVTVRSQKDFNNPPVAFDAFAEPKADATSTTVDVLAKDYDPEGTDLKVSKVSRDGASIDGGSVTVPVTAFAQTIAYEVTDGGSPAATAVAVIHVPPVGGGAPYVKADQTITVGKDGTKTINLSDYVVDPTGKSVRLTTTDKISGAPLAGLTVANSGDTQLVVTGQGGYVGPAAVNFEVTNGSSLDDPAGVSAFLTIPVQIGPETPVLRCPTDPLTVLEGGAPVRIDVASVCHVWVANKADLAGLNFDASWNKPAAGVSVDGSGSHAISVSASGSAHPGDGGELSISVAGLSAAPSTLAVVVAAAPPPTVTPVVIDGFKDGETANVDVTAYVSSRLRDPKISVVSATQTAGMESAARFSGSTVSITPGAKTFGVVTFSFVVSDVADTARTDRLATGTITLNVLNRPDAPTNVAPDRAVLSHVVQVSWTTPANNGAPIDNYQVDYAGGSQSCAASPCSITGLTNGTDYTFTVKAHNLVGLSDASASSASARPDSFPDAVTNLTTSKPLDGNLTLAWNAAHVDGTPVDHYQVSWTGGGSQQVAGSATSMVASGLVNDNKYTFTVIAVNQLGPGGPSTVQGQSAGKPAAPGKPTFTATNDTSGNRRVVVVNWPATDPNGIAPTSYTVTRSSANVSCGSPTATTCVDSGIALDGTIYQYSIVAANAAAGTDAASHTSSPSQPTSMEASATPDAISGISAHVVVATPDGQVPVTINVGASHGKTSTVTCSFSGGACSSPTTFPTGGQSGAAMTLSFPAGWSGSFTLSDCNGSTQSDQAGSSCSVGTGASVSANGPPAAPVGAYCAGDNGSTATFAWSPPGGTGARSVVSFNLSDAGGGNTGSTSYSIGVGVDGQTHTLNVYSVDNNGEQGGYVSIQCTDPSPPPATITISKGPPAPIGNWVSVTLQHFPANSTITLRCWDSYPDNGYWFTTSAHTDGNGYYTGTPNGCYFGYPGRLVRVDSVSPGLQSNTITW
jgi:hypothetical protein